MANPFLVIGGVAVGVVTAGIGVMQVPGWIDSANDSAVREDLSQIAIAQEAAYTVAANYSDSIEDLAQGLAEDNAGTPIKTGVEMQQSSGVELDIDSDGDRWFAAGVSKSGHVFVRSSESAEIYQYVDGEGKALKLADGWLPSGGRFRDHDGRALTGPVRIRVTGGALEVELVAVGVGS